MAIDTQNKRRSTLRVLPVPDGTIGAADRAQVVWQYSGIVISALILNPSSGIVYGPRGSGFVFGPGPGEVVGPRATGLLKVEG